MAWVNAYIFGQAPWKQEIGDFLSSFLPEGLTNRNILTRVNYTHSDTVKRYYTQIGLEPDMVVYLTANAANVPSLKYFVADSSGNCAYTNGGHTIGAALTFTSAKARIDADDPLVEKEVFTVTNTNDSGAGSLRDALAASSTGTKRIQFNLAVKGYFDIGATALGASTGAIFIAGDDSNCPIAWRIANDGQNPLLALANRSEPFYMQHVNLMGANGDPDNQSNLRIGGGTHNFTAAYCTFGYMNSNQLVIYRGAGEDTIEDINLIRCIVHNAIFAGDGTGMNISGNYGASEGDPETPPEDQVYDFRGITNILSYKTLWFNASHRNPLYGGGEGAHPENGGMIVLNNIMYAPGYVSSMVGMEGVADFRSNLYLLPDNSTPINGCLQISQNVPPTQFVGDPSVYMNNNKAVRLTTGQVAWDWDIARHADYTTYYENGQYVVSAVPEGLKRATPLTDPTGSAEETDHDALYADMITNRNCGAFLPSRLPAIEAIFTQIEAHAVPIKVTNKNQIVWDELT